MLEDVGHRRTLTLDDRRTTLALENELWGIIQYLAEEAGYSNWRDWFYEHILGYWDEKRNLASHVRTCLAISLVNELEATKQELDPSRDTAKKMRHMVYLRPTGSNLN